MKIAQKSGELGWYGIGADVEDYDGTPPLATVWFDVRPRAVHPDRLALAGYLLFRPWLSGRIHTPYKHSPALAEAMARDAYPMWLQSEPVELYAKAQPIGAHPVRVSLNAQYPYDAVASLEVLRSDMGGGSNFFANHFSVGSNAWLLGEGSPHDRVRVAAACGVLYSEDLGADALVIDDADVVGFNWSSLANLLSGVRLGLHPTSGFTA